MEAKSGKNVRMGRQNSRISGSVEIPGFDLLALFCVQKLQIGFCDLAGAVSIDVLVQ
jgi:hypothetical protein